MTRCLLPVVCLYTVCWRTYKLSIHSEELTDFKRNGLLAQMSLFYSLLWRVYIKEIYICCALGPRSTVIYILDGHFYKFLQLNFLNMGWISQSLLKLFLTFNKKKKICFKLSVASLIANIRLRYYHFLIYKWFELHKISVCIDIVLRFYEYCL